MESDTAACTGGESEQRFNEILSYLATLEPNTELSWGEDSLHLHPEIRQGSWVDVYVPLICDELGWSWLWTIESDELELNTYSVQEVSDSPELDFTNPSDQQLSKFLDGEQYAEYDPTTLILEHDATIWTVTDVEKNWYQSEFMVVTAINQAPSPGEYATLITAAAATGGTVAELPGWYIESINTALSSWCERFVGRSDIRFRYDSTLSTPLMRYLQNNYDPTATVYEVQEGVYATEQVMDKLLRIELDKIITDATSLGDKPTDEGTPEELNEQS